jgi:hypothetical protein
LFLEVLAAGTKPYEDAPLLAEFVLAEFVLAGFVLAEFLLAEFLLALSFSLLISCINSKA